MRCNIHKLITSVIISLIRNTRFTTHRSNRWISDTSTRQRFAFYYKNVRVNRNRSRCGMVRISDAIPMQIAADGGNAFVNKWNTVISRSMHSHSAEMLLFCWHDEKTPYVELRCGARQFPWKRCLANQLRMQIWTVAIEKLRLLCLLITDSFLEIFPFVLHSNF